MSSGAPPYSGMRVSRVEDARLLTGEEVFVDDVMLPGHAPRGLRPQPIRPARILGIDTTEAAALPGVHTVFVAEDLNHGVRELWYTIIGRVRKDTPRPPLAEDEARFVGDPVAMVIAENRYIAEDAADLVAVEYQPLPLSWTSCKPKTRRIWCTNRTEAMSSALRDRLRRPLTKRWVPHHVS